MYSEVNFSLRLAGGGRAHGIGVVVINIMPNMPRAAVNFNDMVGGGDMCTTISFSIHAEKVETTVPSTHGTVVNHS